VVGETSYPDFKVRGGEAAGIFWLGFALRVRIVKKCCTSSMYDWINPLALYTMNDLLVFSVVGL
jgi:hypothetical protein